MTGEDFTECEIEALARLCRRAVRGGMKTLFWLRRNGIAGEKALAIINTVCTVARAKYLAGFIPRMWRPRYRFAWAAGMAA